MYKNSMFANILLKLFLNILVVKNEKVDLSYHQHVGVYTKKIYLLTKC